MPSTPEQDDYVHHVFGGRHPSTYPPVGKPHGASGQNGEVSGSSRHAGPRASKATFSHVLRHDANTLLLLDALDKGRKRSSGTIQVDGKSIPIRELVTDAEQHLTASANNMIQYNIATKRLAADYPHVADLAEKAQTALNQAKGQTGHSFAKAYGLLIQGTNLAMEASADLSRYHEHEDQRAAVAIGALKVTKFGAFWAGSVVAMMAGGPYLALAVNELEVGVDTLEDARVGEFDWKKTAIDVIVAAVTAAYGKKIDAYLEKQYEPMVAALVKKNFAHDAMSPAWEQAYKELQEKAEERIGKLVAGIANKIAEESVKKVLHDLFAGEEGEVNLATAADKLQKGLAPHLDSIIGGEMRAEAKLLARTAASTPGEHRQLKEQ